MSYLSLWFTFGVFAVNIYIGLRVLLINKKQDCNKFFFCMTLLTSFWLVFNYLALKISDDAISLLFVRLVMFVTSLLANVIYYLAITFPNHQLKAAKKISYPVLIWIIFVSLLSLSSAVFTSCTHIDGSLSLSTGWGIIFYGLNLLFLVRAIWIFYRKIRVAKGIEKIRLTYLTIAFALAIIVSSLFNFFFPVILNNNNYTTFGSSMLTLALAVLIGYSLLKIRFSSIDFTIAKIIYWSAILIWIVIPFICAHYFSFSYRGTYIIGIPICLAWLWCLLQIYEKFELFLTKRIVNHGADWHAEKKLFLQSISKELSYKTILDQTLIFYNLLIKNHGNLIIGDFFEDAKISVTGDHKLQTSPREFFELCYKLWPGTHQDVNSLIYEELVLRSDRRFDKIVKLMAKNNIGSIFAISFYDELKGIILMSNKLDGNPYFAQDIEMIESTLTELGPLLNKTIIFQGSQDFNTYLQKKIDRATIKLKKTNEKLIIADQLKDEFVSVASHELRTPMTAIKNYLWVIEKNLAKGKYSEIPKHLQITINSTERLIRMVNDMLTISRIEGNRYNLNKQTHDLQKISKQVYQDLLPIARNKKISLRLDFSPKPVLASVDSTKIIEVFHNLIGNALKFTMTGEVIIKCYTKNDQAFFAVIDSGPGIAPEDADKLFKKFTRLEKSYVKIKETGTGLGLYISKEIMHKHGGDITFTSVLGKGSTFTANFPGAKK